jgi:GTP-binding protein Era
MGFKSGFVGVLGQTNVGKSTFINAILGKKVLIVSEKRQATRNRIRCIYNDPEAQIIFVDTPGLHRPVDKLSGFLLKQAFGALEGLDLILYMIEPWVAVQEYDQKMFEQMRVKGLSSPKFLLINKIDKAKGDEVPKTIENYAKTGLFDEIIPISCKLGINLGKTVQLIKNSLPEGPKYFPDETTVDRPEEFVIAEIIREKIYNLTRQEIPYSVYVEVVEVKEREERPLVEVYANIYVAKPSQKGILIGAGGKMIKEIGRLARMDLEALLGTHVYLDLQVKVREKWNEDERRIARVLGPE